MVNERAREHLYFLVYKQWCSFLKTINYLSRNDDDDSVAKMNAAEQALESKQKVFVTLFSGLMLFVPNDLNNFRQFVKTL